ncbi:MAG TPA: CPBP family glutamic-type intramembrane protease [Chryseolinea sp.]
MSERTTPIPAYYTNSTRTAEIAAVVLTGLGKFLLVDWLHLKFWYVTTACVLWIVYILYRIKTNLGVPAYWGFRKEGFSSSLRWIGPVSLIALGGFIVFGIVKGTLVFNWHILPIMILYPLWGTIQQFLIIGLITRNMEDCEGRRAGRAFIIVVSSIVFSVVHFPSIALVAATAMLAIGYTIIYLQYRNLWILGLFHGWLGCCFYFFVLGRDPWLEFVSAVK